MIMQDNLDQLLDGFLRDPADSSFQQGYLSALLDLYREQGWSRDDLNVLRDQVRS